MGKEREREREREREKREGEREKRERKKYPSAIEREREREREEKREGEREKREREKKPSAIDTSMLCSLAWQGLGKIWDHGVDHMLWSRLCSPPTFVWAWETGKRRFLYTSWGIVHPNGTGQTTAMTSPSLFFLPSVTMCQHFLRIVAWLASLACEAVFPTLCIPHAFLRVPCAFLFKALNSVDWLPWLTRSLDVSIPIAQQSVEYFHCW